MNEGFSKRLRDCMNNSNYTQKELAELCGITEAAFSRYMTMERIPKAEILANIATALQTTSEYLISGKNPYEDYAELKGLVARSSSKLTDTQKNELINLLENINKRMEF